MINRRAGIGGLALLSYLGACIAVALRFDLLDRPKTQPHQLMRGYELLLGGWKPAAIFAGVSLLLALQTLMLFGQRVIADEGGVTHMTLSGLYAGFYFWLAAMAVVLLGSLSSRRAS